MVATVVNVQVKNEEKIETAPKKVVFDTKNLNLWYGEDHALKDINLSIHENEVTAIIGPSGCGKSTYLKTLNRMVELVPIVRTTGVIEYRERNIFDKSYPVEELRT
ncbi:phosphate ABC transporter ATP-binding protein, partial [Bacillus sp. ZZQ-131]